MKPSLVEYTAIESKHKEREAAEEQLAQEDPGQEEPAALVRSNED